MKDLYFMQQLMFKKLPIVTFSLSYMTKSTLGCRVCIPDDETKAKKMAVKRLNKKLTSALILFSIQYVKENIKFIHRTSDSLLNPKNDNRVTVCHGNFWIDNRTIVSQYSKLLLHSVYWWWFLRRTDSSVYLEFWNDNFAYL